MNEIDAPCEFISPDSAYISTITVYSLQGAGTDETVLVEIMTSRTNEELDEIKAIYEKGIKALYSICLCFLKQ